MTECPDIDELVSNHSSAAGHSSGCAACSAVSTLSDLRDARTAARGDECVDAEVALALQSEGLLDDEGAAVLAAHLERCAECNEVAVRVAAARGRFSPDRAVAERGGVPTPEPERWGLVLGFVAVAAASAAAGALWMHGRAAPEDRVVAETPRRAPESRAPRRGSRAHRASALSHARADRRAAGRTSHASPAVVVEGTRRSVGSALSARTSDRHRILDRSRACRAATASASAEGISVRRPWCARRCPAEGRTWSFDTPKCSGS